MSDLQNIKLLREKTGAGMVDCQKALVEAEGDMEKAIEVLRKKGLEKAGKKAERSTNEGLITLVQENNKIAAITLLCETDFVARNADFVAAVEEMAKHLLAVGEADFRLWAEKKITDELIVKIGENIKLGGFGISSGDTLGSYLHSNKKVAAVVILTGGSVELANELAMQVAAMSPRYIDRADVPADVLAKEKEIYREQMQNEKKPAEVLEKIINGKLEKFYVDVCLLRQAFIKDDKMTVEDLLKSSSNGEVKVVSFSRYQV